MAAEESIGVRVGLHSGARKISGSWGPKHGLSGKPKYGDFVSQSLFFEVQTILSNVTDMFFFFLTNRKAEGPSKTEPV